MVVILTQYNIFVTDYKALSDATTNLLYEYAGHFVLTCTAFFFFETGSCIAPRGLEFVIPLLQPPKYWDYKIIDGYSLSPSLPLFLPLPFPSLFPFP
jgi:hypothetical protein